MKSFEVSDCGPADFLRKLTQALKGRSLGEIVSFENRPGEISIIFSKLGKSELKFAVKENSPGFVATLTDEKIAFAHKMARGDIERKLLKVIGELGGKAN